MAVVRKLANGEICVCHSPKGKTNRLKLFEDDRLRKEWIIKARPGTNSNSVSIGVGNIYFPLDFLGKRVKIKIEELK